MNLDEILANSDENLKLLAVTKGRTVPQILTMLEETSITRIGENRLEEAMEKLLPLKAKWATKHPNNPLEKHFIGKLQSRKISKIVKFFDVIQSVETIEQAEKISAAAAISGPAESAKNIQTFIQVNISSLPQRSGAPADLTQLQELAAKITALPNINLIGLMGMASQDPQKVRQEFRTLKSLQTALTQTHPQITECSMGMSSDYKIAIEEGSTMIRLGRVLFEDTTEVIE
jgi:PLP dependent protein